MAANTRIDRRKTPLNNVKDLISISLPDLNLDHIEISLPIMNDLDNGKNTKLILTNKPDQTALERPVHFCYNRLLLTDIHPTEESLKVVYVTASKLSLEDKTEANKELLNQLTLVNDSINILWPETVSQEEPNIVNLLSGSGYLYDGNLTIHVNAAVES